MKPSTYLIRFKRLLVLGAVVAGIAVPAASAVVRPPDVQDAASSIAGGVVATPPDVKDAAAALHSTPAGITADGLRLQGMAQVYKDLQSAPSALGLKADGMRFEGIAQVYKDLEFSAAPDAIERYAKEHPYGAGLSVQSTPVDRIIAQEQGRQDDLGLFSLGLTSQTGSTLVSRPPDVSDAAQAVRYGVSVGQSGGFDWSDWAIGIGSGIGLMLLLAGVLAGERQRRHHMQTA